MRSRLKNGTLINIAYLGYHQEVLPVVASWIYREWSFLYVGKTRHYVEEFLRQRLDTRRMPLTMVAFVEGKPVGTVSLKESDMESRPYLTPWVTSLYVVPRWRGKGIGAGLMHAVERKAVRMGKHQLFLFTADAGLAARFYHPLGWKIKEHTSYYSYPVIIMEKDV